MPDHRLLQEVLGCHCGDGATALADYRLLTNAHGLPDFVQAIREQDFPDWAATPDARHACGTGCPVRASGAWTN